MSKFFKFKDGNTVRFWRYDAINWMRVQDFHETLGYYSIVTNIGEVSFLDFEELQRAYKKLEK